MRILLIHTGGTIGMIPSAEGFMPEPGIVESAVTDLLAAGKVNADVEIRLFDRLIDSAQATPNDWNRISQRIYQARDSFDAVVVTHGSDTLAYTAGALCLALPGLRIPVVMTGSMLPLTVEGNDGWRNLTDALNVAQTVSPGVWVQFAGRLLHGARVRKSHSHAFDAFEADTWQTEPVLPADRPEHHLAKRHRVGVISMTPGMHANLLRYAADNSDGLVVRCFGSGTAPDEPDVRAALHRAKVRDIPVLAVSQCPEGGMRLGTYAAGKILRDTGAIDGRDITLEMAYAKMQFALTQHATADARRAYLEACLCGEVTL